ncbi:MAG TPA: hypothetical protein VE868_02825 [Balneolaceae bacterium]|nr:hypothetical protein [Balneolaceae bacterium]
MSDIPFAIPESLASYAVQFESAPDKTIRRLKKQLKKRGPDPVGYFLLGWFFHRKDLNNKAINYALKAKSFAPGSPFFRKLHYYFSHPNEFEAWQSDAANDLLINKKAPSSKDNMAPGPIVELDNLIEKLASAESKRRKTESPGPTDSSRIRSAQSDEDDNIVSETLAEIHEKQGKIDAAIRTYKKLMQQDEEKRDNYIIQITRLEKLKKKKEEEEE